MLPVTARALVLLLCLPALFAGCGDAPTSREHAARGSADGQGAEVGALLPPPELIEVVPTPIGTPVPDRLEPVRISAQQVEAARAAGVPPAVRDPHGITLVYIPPGNFLMGTPEDGNEATVHIDRGFYMQVGLYTWDQLDPTWAEQPRYRELAKRYKAWAQRRGTGAAPPVSAEPDEARSIAAQLATGPLTYRLPTEAEWAYACRAGTRTPYWWGTRPLRGDERATYVRNPWGLEEMLTGNSLQICSDWHAALPSWERSDPMGPEKGNAVVLRGGPDATATTRSSAPVEGYAFGHRPQFRLVAPVGYGLGHYGSVQVTFHLVDEDGKDAPNDGYDLRIIAMNDRLAARVTGKDAVWVRVAKPTLPITLSMVPGSYYVYAEGHRDGELVRGLEQKFHAKGDALRQPVPVPPADLSRFGSGVHSEPK